MAGMGPLSCSRTVRTTAKDDLMDSASASTLLRSSITRWLLLLPLIAWLAKCDARTFLATVVFGVAVPAACLLIEDHWWYQSIGKDRSGMAQAQRANSSEEPDPQGKPPVGAHRLRCNADSYLIAASHEPFRLLDLPPELIIHIIALLDDSSTCPPSLPDRLDNTSHGRQAYRPDLCSLSLTCSSLRALCRPLIHRWLFLPKSVLPQFTLSGPGRVREYDRTIMTLTMATNLWTGPAFVSSLWITGPYLTRPQLDMAEPRTELENGFANVLERSMSRFSHLTFLELSYVSNVSAARCLAAAPATLRAVSLASLFPPVPPLRGDQYGFEVPSLPQLRALKIFECEEHWFKLVTTAETLEHICIWQPAHGFSDMSWLREEQLKTLKVVNLDGFRRRPQLLLTFCKMIEKYCSNPSNPPIALANLDIEAYFSPVGPVALLPPLLSALALCPSLQWLAISCITKRHMSPSVLDDIAAAVGDRLRFLLVMVKGYETARWPGEVAGYAHALRHFTHLRTFCLNHSFPITTSSFANAMAALAESDDDDDDSDVEDLAVDMLNPLFARPQRRQTGLTGQQRRFLGAAGHFLGSGAPCKTLRRLIQVECLWANKARGNVVTYTGSEAEIQQKQEAIAREKANESGGLDGARLEEDDRNNLTTRLRQAENLGRLLLPFEKAWAGL